ncbi:MAG: hypothetical protein HY788_13605 [Deltaproteobacteria bacterium]|nr:hypothetical protein [Deltaproteobacteria bacterium]
MSLHRTEPVSIWMRILFVSLFLSGFFSTSIEPAHADDVKSLLKEANSELRTAERLMFEGKTDEAIAAIPKIKSLIDQAKSADPGNVSVKTTENKMVKFIKDLERRTGKDVGAGALTAQSESKETNLPPKPEVKTVEKSAVEQPAMVASGVKLPGEVSSRLEKMDAALKKGDVKAAQRLMGEIERGYSDHVNHPEVIAARERLASPSSGQGEAAAPSSKTTVTAQEKAAGTAKLPYEARRPMDQINASFRSVESGIAKLNDPDYRGSKDQVITNLRSSLSDIETTLTEVRELAARKGVTSHPDIHQAEALLANMKTSVDESVAEYERTGAIAEKQSQGVNKDVEALRLEYERLRIVFDKAPGVPIYYNDLKPVEETILAIEDFEKNELPKVTPTMEAFAEKYGSTGEEIERTTSELGYSGQGRAAFPYEELVKGVRNVRLTRTVMAEDLAKRVQDKLQNLPRLHDFNRLQQHDVIRQWLQMAQRFSPDHPMVKELTAGIEPKLADDTASFKQRIADRTWPKNASNAPDNADELVEAAMDYFNQVNAQDKDPRTQLAVVITGPWSVQQTNLLGEPIMYGLPVLGAVQLDRENHKNLARVFVLTLRTAEGKGVKMAPPFVSDTVGDSYYMPADKVR